MKNYKRVALLLCIMLLTGTFAGCGWSKKEKDKSENSTKSSEDKAVDEITLDGMVSDALSKMTLKEKSVSYLLSVQTPLILMQKQK